MFIISEDVIKADDIGAAVIDWYLNDTKWILSELLFVIFCFIAVLIQNDNTVLVSLELNNIFFYV